MPPSLVPTPVTVKVLDELVKLLDEVVNFLDELEDVGLVGKMFGCTGKIVG